MSQLDEKVYVLDEFPVPPSVNKMYATYNNRRIATREYGFFKQEVDDWSLERKELLKECSDYFREQVDRGKWVQLAMFWCVPKEKMFTLKQTVRKVDVSNRVKAAHDAVSKLIEVDDCHFSIGTTEKVLADDEEKVLIVLKAVEMVRESDVTDELFDEPKTCKRLLLF